MLSEKILGDPCWPLGQTLTGLFQPVLGGGQLFGRAIITERTILFISANFWPKSASQKS